LSANRSAARLSRVFLVGIVLLLVGPGCKRQTRQADPAPNQSRSSASIADRPLEAARSAQPQAAATATTAGTLQGERITGVQARFFAFGDGGTASPGAFRVGKALAAFCAKEKCGFGLHTGDIVYPEGIRSPADPYLLERVEKPYADLGVPLYFSLGNHDHYGNADAMVKAWADGSPARKRGILDGRLPAAWYTFIRDGVRFLVLDTQARGEPQSRWAREVLSNSAEKGEAWVIALGHHPLRSSGQHGDAEGELRDWLRAILCDRVDVYISGHDHNKEVLEPECGVHQIISGAAGQLRDVEAKEGSIWAASTLGWAWLIMRDDSLALSFHDEQGRVEARRTLLRRPRKR